MIFRALVKAAYILTLSRRNPLKVIETIASISMPPDCGGVYVWYESGIVKSYWFANVDANRLGRGFEEARLARLAVEK